MANLRDIRRRIRSVQNTQQITKAMEMVSAAKLRRAQTRLEEARPYAAKLKEVLENLAAVAAQVNHPLFEKRPVEKRALVVVTADKGLAGALNANVIRRAEAYLKSSEGQKTSLITIGRKGGEYFRRRRAPVLAHYQEMGDLVDHEKAETASREIVRRFLDHEVDEILVLGTRFISAMSRAVELSHFLPIEPPEGKKEPENYIFEPSAEAIFESLIPRYVTNRLVITLLEASASEHGARMIAMGSASRNARDMISDLTLVRNRVRQAQITKEIAEIVGGAEALK
ncbi:MAG TPA: ATP synthase F1 subunit gamma [Candidatus Eisenbacteria bacterium]|nr:ATP synthase F1 subunit gamma [Candidatus Eisenbacteria bacterium]